ncbi:unnamed protein product [Paramecium octaurelia]|uniref:Uncharacterized protein n=1 Tax=Paramecium octaurelia TaxID=43137 RepID=A0A8S1WG38_PAROT|nr:unnamed protein product [Paramecium octaurelia]
MRKLEFRNGQKNSSQDLIVERTKINVKNIFLDIKQLIGQLHFDPENANYILNNRIGFWTHFFNIQEVFRREERGQNAIIPRQYQL